jgi:Ca-activated chloride channel family protein
MGFGLIDASSGSVAQLLDVRVDVELLDYIGRVKITKQYENFNKENASLQYTFPLDDLSAVHDFKATIDNEIILAKIFEKEEAKQKYNKAISENKTAILLDNNEAKPDTFTLLLGNFEKNSKITIEISYITELIKTNENDLRFFLPKGKNL